MQTNRHWNYRLMRFVSTETGERWWAIHEVHYVNDKPTMYSDDPAPVYADNPDEVYDILQRMMDCLEKEALTLEDFNKEKQR